MNCSRCGKRYLGVSANGNKYKYRYYVCYTRHRYGTATCAAERLPADQLEQGVFGSLLETLSRTDLIEAAVANTYNELGIDRDQYTQELASVEVELVKTRDAIDRYLTAFENGTMPEATCAPRIATLAEKAEQLTEGRDELGLLLEETPAPPQPDPGLQAALYAHALEAIHGGADGIAKQLMQALVHEVRVTGPRRVKPVFRIPTDGLTELADDEDTPESPTTQSQVRTLTRSVPPAGPVQHGNAPRPAME